MSQVDAPAQVWTVQKVLESTAAFFDRKKVEPPRLCAEMVLGHVLGAPRIKLYTDLARRLTDDELTRARELVRRVGGGEPIQYATGSAGFYGLEFEVTPAVLIPRSDTETLVEAAAKHLKALPAGEPPRVLDLCTGSGCVAAAVAQQVPTARVVATDLSADALAVARRNVERYKLGERVTLAEGDLFGAVAAGDLFDAIVANPPYIPSGDIAGLDANVRDFEPRLALDGGDDGLAVLGRIAREAGAYLKPGAPVMVEVQFDQAGRVGALFEGAGLERVRAVRDLQGHERVVVGYRAE